MNTHPEHDVTLDSPKLQSLPVDSSSLEEDPPDGGWGWVVMVAMFFMQCVAAANAMCFGVLYMEFLDYFQAGHAITAWVGSLCATCLSLTGLITGFIVHRFGLRTTIVIASLVAAIGHFSAGFCTTVYQLYFTYGIITGCGIGVAWTAGIVGLGKYFTKRRGVAYGFTLSGSGVGMMLYPVITEYLLRMYAWQGTLIILSGLWLNMCIVGLLYRPIKTSLTTTVKKRKDSLFTEWTFYALGLIELFYTVTIYIFIVNVPDFARSHGYSNEKASQLVLIMGAVLVPARLITGYIASKNVNSIFLAAVYTFLMSVTVGTCYLGTSYAYIVVYAICQGWLQGGIVVLTPLMCTDLFGADRMGQAFAYIQISDVVSTLIGPVISGFIKDETGSYTYAFILGGGYASLAGVCCIVVYLKVFRFPKKRNDKVFECDNDDISTLDSIYEDRHLNPQSDFVAQGNQS